MRFAGAALAAYFAMALAGCGHAPGYPPQPVATPAEVADFATLYSQNCAACHGRNGQNGPAIDLGNPEYQALADDDVLNSWISGGIPGTEMPAFAQSAGGALSNRQIDAPIQQLTMEGLHKPSHHFKTHARIALRELVDRSSDEARCESRNTSNAHFLRLSDR